MKQYTTVYHAVTAYINGTHVNIVVSSVLQRSTLKSKAFFKARVYFWILIVYIVTIAIDCLESWKATTE